MIKAPLADKVHQYDSPVEFKGFRAVGIFGYCEAFIENGTVKVPRDLFYDIEKMLPMMSNKSVVLFEDTTRFGTENFAINFYDLFAIVGRWEDVKPY